MIITKKYILKHQTRAGAWTKSQIEALGISWPPLKGWMDLVDGTVITDSMAKQFERKLTVKETKHSGINYNMLAHKIISDPSQLSDNTLVELKKCTDYEIGIRELL